MNATTKNTFTAMALQTILAFLIVWAVLGATKAHAWTAFNQQQPMRYGQIYQGANGYEVYQGQTQRYQPSTTTVIGDPRGLQNYMDSGSMIQRIGSGDGPRTWLRSGNTIYQLGE